MRKEFVRFRMADWKRAGEMNSGAVEGVEVFVVVVVVGFWRGVRVADVWWIARRRRRGLMLRRRILDGWTGSGDGDVGME